METKKELRCFLRFKLSMPALPCSIPPKREKETSRGSYCCFFFVSPFLFSFFFFPLDNIKRGKNSIDIYFPLFIVIFQSMEHDSRRLISISLNKRDNSSNFFLRKSCFLAIKFSQTKILEYLANKGINQAEISLLRN